MSSSVEYKTRFSLAWNYRKDESWMNSLSAQGLHMDKIGLFRYRFRSDTTVRYVYRYDVQVLGSLKDEKFKDYINLYTDTGWEYIDSFMSWHLFRKPYVPGENDELYTDRPSRSAMLNRLSRIFLFIGLLNLAAFIYNFIVMLNYWPESVYVLVPIVNLLCALLLFYGMRKLKKLSSRE